MFYEPRRVEADPYIEEHVAADYDDGSARDLLINLGYTEDDIVAMLGFDEESDHEV